MPGVLDNQGNLKITTSVVRTAASEFTVKNTSGGAVDVGDLGYIDEAGEYKETTTVYDELAWCVVLTPGGNNADIYVARRGRVTIVLNGNCSAGDYLYTSTTAGQAQPLSYVRSEVMAVALTANAAGAGGTCEALLLCNRTYISDPVSMVYFCVGHADYDFISTIATLPGGANFTYGAVTSGSETTIEPYNSVDYNYKLVIANTTRGDDALIQDVNIGTNTVTLTANVPGTWQVGDAISARSQTATGLLASSRWYELDVEDTIDPLATVLTLSVEFLDSTNAGELAATGSLQATPTTEIVRNQVAGPIYAVMKTHTVLRNRRFCIAGMSGGTTANSAYRQPGYFVASP